MYFFRALQNNIRHDIWGNFQMARSVGAWAGYSYLARKSKALAKAILNNRVIVVNNREFFDTWS